MKNNRCKVSVITACYNTERYLKECIAGILSQTYTDFEWIIVDDGSLDSSVDIIKSFDDPRIRLIQQQNRGPGSARNKAISNSMGEYLAIVDSDDICLPERLALQVAFLDEHPDCVGVGGDSIFMTADGDHIYMNKNLYHDKYEIKSQFDQGACPMSHPTMMFRTIDFKKTKGYPEDTNHGEDYFLMQQILKWGYFVNIPTPLIKYRINDGSLTCKTSQIAKTIYSLLKKKKKGHALDADEVAFLTSYKKSMPEIDKKTAYYYCIANLYFMRASNLRKGLIYTWYTLRCNLFYTKNYLLLLKASICVINIISIFFRAKTKQE